MILSKESPLGTQQLYCLIAPGMSTGDLVWINPLPGVPHPHLPRDQYQEALDVWRANGQQPRAPTGGADFATRLCMLTFHLRDYTDISDVEALEMDPHLADEIALRDLEQNVQDVGNSLDTSFGFDPSVQHDITAPLPEGQVIRVFWKNGTGRQQSPQSLLRCGSDMLVLWRVVMCMLHWKCR